MCPLLNIALDWDSPPYHDNTPSLDRIDNSKGYIKGNVHWVSWRANRLMSNMQPDEIFMLAQNYKKDIRRSYTLVAQWIEQQTSNL